MTGAAANAAAGAVAVGPTEARPLTVLIASAGRRVELLAGFRRALATLDLHGRVIATDSSWYSGALHDADAGFLVPRCDDAAFVPHMLDLCAAERVDLLVPTTDREMPVLAPVRDRFHALGTAVALSAAEVVGIASDKVRTHHWLVAQGFPTVDQASPAAVLADPARWSFPLIVKPRFGSAGVGVGVVHDAVELAAAVESAERRDGPDTYRELVAQTIAAGVEHTVDVLVNAHGRAVCAVPRRRLEVRAGEVSKGVTVDSPALVDLASRIAEALPGAFGALNVQVFVDDDTGEMSVIEVNARYGGGFPLSLAAGADFPRWMLEELAGLPSTASSDAWRAGLVMLRYDAAVFVDEADAQAAPHIGRVHGAPQRSEVAP